MFYKKLTIPLLTTQQTLGYFKDTRKKDSSTRDDFYKKS